MPEADALLADTVPADTLPEDIPFYALSCKIKEHWVFPKDKTEPLVSIDVISCLGIPGHTGCIASLLA